MQRGANLRANLLAAACKGPAELRASLLLDRLLRSGSTWEKWTKESIPDGDRDNVLRAVDAQGDRWVSHVEVGLSELLIAAWIRRRVATSCARLSPVGRLQGEQALAAQLLLQEPIACLSGLPGTGKTWVLRSV